MKHVISVCIGLALVVAGQTFKDLPGCSLPCLNDAVKQSTTCAATDTACICSKFDIVQGAAAGCVLRACGQDVALNKVLPDTQKLCQAAGSGKSTDKPGQAPANQPHPTGTVPTVVPLPPVETSQRATQEPISTGAPTSSPPATAGAIAIAPLGGLAMLIVGMLTL
ncbi:hypothetical protein QQS21_005434 [Conoideocrella luteorostrata]|uniref:CFEM domain-containing protein n=1 Tax=Conoideocrella luteorostrata TaxID=1105319 RepID=A0AAJ0CPF0_9HYPO|nr:hypothetical protein QQS21_005434 [Conoideocrella luteorostrata]